MPELPEAETIARGLGVLISGRRLRAARCLLRAICDRRVKFPVGARVAGVGRRGKKVLIHFDNDTTLLIALGMSGSLQRRNGPLPRHTHLVMDFGDMEIIYVDPRRLGRLRPAAPATTMLARRGAVKAFCESRLGPDADVVGWSDFRARFTGRRAPIKVLLLNQRLVAGIGNIYADEILYRARVHPRTRPAEMNDGALRRVHRAARVILNRAIAACGTTFRDYVTPAGARGAFGASLQVYGRAGERCRRCGAVIRAERWPPGRTSHFCPRCQRRRK